MINKSPFNTEEVIFIYEKLKELISKQRKHICNFSNRILGRDICVFFPNREVWIIQTIILFHLSSISKNLVYFYADKPLKRFCIINLFIHKDFERLRALTQLTWLIVLFLSNYKPNLLQSHSSFFV